MGRRDVITGVVVGCVAVGYLAMALGLPDRGASRSGMAPSVYPLSIGAMLLIAAAAQVTVALVGRRRAPATPSGETTKVPTRWVRAGVLFAGAWLYLWLLGVLGFLIASTLFLAFAARLVGGAAGREDWLRRRPAAAALGYAAITSLTIQILFGELLGVLLPPGLLPNLVG